MTKTGIGLVLLLALSVAVVSCAKGPSSSSQHKASGLAFRAFVSNSLFPQGAFNGAVLNIVDAKQDKLSTFNVSLLGILAQATLMAVSPDLRLTLVFSPSTDSIGIIDNTTEMTAAAPGGTTGLPAIALPGTTESMFIAKDNATAYAAVPNASVAGSPPGAVVQIRLSTGAITATIPVAGAHFIVPTPDGSHILVFSDNSDSLTVIAASLIGSGSDPRTVITGTAQDHFDRPVWAVFADNSTAEIFNCGPECGGTAAGISPFNLGSSAPDAMVPVSAATYGVLVNSTLYVAGTPPNTACGSGTSAPTCGTLNLFDVDSKKVTNSQPIIITDGYHNRMAMGANGRLFIGAHTCSSFSSGSEIRGCLSIFNSTTNQVVVPPQTGDATGIAPVAGRNVVYVCQGGMFLIFDTTTDKLLVQDNPIDIVGQPFDVKLVDPPQS